MEIEFSPPTLAIRDRALDPQVIGRSRTWPLRVDLDQARQAPALAGVFLRCGACGQAVARLAWGAPTGPALKPLVSSVQELEAATLAHVLQVHRRDVDPGWSGT